MRFASYSGSITRIVTLLAATLLCAPLSADTQTEIETLMELQEEAWNERDLETLRSTYHEDFRLFASGTVLDRDQRMGDIALVMEDGKDQGKIDYLGIVVEPLGEKRALVYGGIQLKFEDGTRLDSWFSSVMVDTSFGWKTLFTHSNP